MNTLLTVGIDFKLRNLGLVRRAMLHCDASSNEQWLGANLCNYCLTAGSLQMRALYEAHNPQKAHDGTIGMHQLDL